MLVELCCSEGMIQASAHYCRTADPMFPRVRVSDIIGSENSTPTDLMLANVDRRATQSSSNSFLFSLAPFALKESWDGTGCTYSCWQPQIAARWEPVTDQGSLGYLFPIVPAIPWVGLEGFKPCWSVEQCLSFVCLWSFRALEEPFLLYDLFEQGL